MESSVFPQPSVVEELLKFVRVDLVTDLPNDVSRKKRDLQGERFKNNTLPLYVILDSEGQELDRAGYMRSADDYVAFLRGDPKSAD